MTDFFHDHAGLDNHVHDPDPHIADPNAHHHVPVPVCSTNRMPHNTFRFGSGLRPG
jgi:hypothetical protein